ncbi:MAG: histidine phosphatase family protein [Deltaproteobacteria bacterium]|nr:histidine phosphatase family protein [Deltaproteobacteria bacterium]
MTQDLALLKTLVLLRHAKSSWKDAGLADVDRPLKRRGREAVGLIALWLRKRGAEPDRIVSSPARRALETAELLKAALGLELDVVIDPALYLADPARIWDVVRTSGAKARTVVLVGHNEGLEDLVSLIADRPIRMPTAAAAVVSVPARSWARANRSEARLVDVARPRELEAAE